MSSLPHTAERVKTVRKMSGESQSKFAETVGVTRSLINHIEAGRSKPSRDLLVRIAERYSVSTDYLLGRE